MPFIALAFKVLLSVWIQLHGLCLGLHVSLAVQETVTNADPSRVMDIINEMCPKGAAPWTNMSSRLTLLCHCPLCSERRHDTPSCDYTKYRHIQIDCIGNVNKWDRFHCLYHLEMNYEDLEFILQLNVVIYIPSYTNQTIHNKKPLSWRPIFRLNMMSCRKYSHFSTAGIKTLRPASPQGERQRDREREERRGGVQPDIYWTVRQHSDNFLAVPKPETNIQPLQILPLYFSKTSS